MPLRSLLRVIAVRSARCLALWFISIGVIVVPNLVSGGVSMRMIRQLDQDRPGLLLWLFVYTPLEVVGVVVVVSVAFWAEARFGKRRGAA